MKPNKKHDEPLQIDMSADEFLKRVVRVKPDEVPKTKKVLKPKGNKLQNE